MLVRYLPRWRAPLQERHLSKGDSSLEWTSHHKEHFSKDYNFPRKISLKGGNFTKGNTPTEDTFQRSSAVYKVDSSDSKHSGPRSEKVSVAHFPRGQRTASRRASVIKLSSKEEDRKGEMRKGYDSRVKKAVKNRGTVAGLEQYS